MKIIFIKISLFFLVLLHLSCKQNNTDINNSTVSLTKYATGFSIEKNKGYSLLKVTKPWPKATKEFIYILKEKNGQLPDSLKKYPIIAVPIQSIIVSSTTHIPSLEMLEVENTLIGFPHLNYISSPKIRTLIDANKIAEIGSNQDLNIERVIDLQPSVIIGFGIDNTNPSLENLQKSGLKVLLNGDWNEQTPLGKAEWIKFFGALYCKEKKADSIFNTIEDAYLQTATLSQKATTRPTVLSGDIYQNSWNMPSGDSWGCQILKQAKTQYLWSETTGTGSLSLSLETVYERAKMADFWFTSGQFISLANMQKANKHYAQFDAFKNKKVYSLSKSDTKNGGVLFYELAPNRPDLVLKDILKITHPELLPNHKLIFFEQLR